MACIRKRRGKYVVDYRDGLGIRHWVTCETKRDADAVLAKKVQERHHGVRPDTQTTVAEYARRWLGVLRASVKQATIERYEDLLAHILPTFGAAKVSRVRRAHIKGFLAEKLRSGLSRDSVRLIHATLRAMLNAAVEDELHPDNPAARLGKQLRLVLPAKARQEEVKAMNREQLAKFLAAARTEAPRYATLFLTLARTGLRLGEALAPQWDDIDFGTRELRVARSLAARGRIDTPKSGHGRTVDVSQQLAGALRELRVQRETETLRRGWRGLPPWVFCSRTGNTLDRHDVTHTFKRVLKVAALPGHFSPHSLRHTFASLLLQHGESPAYVQRQLGHASIQLTVDTCGKWLPLGNKAAVDQLDAAAAVDHARAV